MVVFPTPTSAASWRCESSNRSRSLLEESNGVVRHRYTPHSCRHTFATLLKDVPAPDKDKLRLIGPTSAEMLRPVFGPSVEIRTRGLLNPIQARYQTSPHPDTIFTCCITSA